MSNKTVVITGASTGIGAACALYLDQQGFTVFAGVRKDSDGEALQEQSSSRLTPLTFDVTKPDQIVSAVGVISQKISPNGLDGLINNAGIAVSGPLEFLPIDDFRRQLEINLVGAVAVTQAFLPLIRQAKGRILHMSSFGGTIAAPFLGAYHASKFALEAVTDAMRMELKPWGIEVIAIKPAAIKTPIWSKSRNVGKTLLEKLPPEASVYYDRPLDKALKYIQYSEEHGAEVSVVLKAVHHALTAKNPKTRYVVAINRVVFHLLRLMPDRLRDRVILNQIGLRYS